MKTNTTRREMGNSTDTGGKNEQEKARKVILGCDPIDIRVPIHAG